jgi:hypothetical protein
MGLRVHPRVEKKLHDLEESSFTHYKKNSKQSHLQKNNGDHVLGLWRPPAV